MTTETTRSSLESQMWQAAVRLNDPAVLKAKYVDRSERQGIQQVNAEINVFSGTYIVFTSVWG